MGYGAELCIFKPFIVSAVQFEDGGSCAGTQILSLLRLRKEERREGRDPTPSRPWGWQGSLGHSLSENVPIMTILLLSQPHGYPRMTQEIFLQDREF